MRIQMYRNQALERGDLTATPLLRRSDARAQCSRERQEDADQESVDPPPVRPDQPAKVLQIGTQPTPPALAASFPLRYLER